MLDCIKICMECFICTIKFQVNSSNLQLKHGGHKILPVTFLLKNFSALKLALGFLFLFVISHHSVHGLLRLFLRECIIIHHSTSKKCENIVTYFLFSEVN